MSRAEPLFSVVWESGFLPTCHGPTDMDPEYFARWRIECTGYVCQKSRACRITITKSLPADMVEGAFIHSNFGDARLHIYKKQRIANERRVSTGYSAAGVLVGSRTSGT